MHVHLYMPNWDSRIKSNYRYPVSTGVLKLLVIIDRNNLLGFVTGMTTPLTGHKLAPTTPEAVLDRRNAEVKDIQIYHQAGLTHRCARKLRMPYRRRRSRRYRRIGPCPNTWGGLLSDNKERCNGFMKERTMCHPWRFFDALKRPFLPWNVRDCKSCLVVSL